MAKRKHQQTELQKAFGKYVRGKFELAKEAKRDIHDTMLTCLRQIRGEELGCEANPEVDVRFNITAPILRGVVSLIRDVLANVNDSPYELIPSPVVDLNKKAENELAGQVRQVMPRLIAGMAGDPERILANVDDLKASMMLEESKAALLAAQRLTPVLKDKLQDAEWGNSFSDFIYNLVWAPAAIIKSPSAQTKSWKKWNGNTLEVVSEVITTVENISPFDFYPAPHATSVDSAEFICERRRVNPSELIDFAVSPSFDADSIRLVLETYPDGKTEDYEVSESDTEPAVDDQEFTADDNPVGVYDCIGFYGRVKGKFLMLYGLEDLDAERTYEAEVWSVGDIVIKAMLNPDPLGKRPFHTATFEPIPGAIWGYSPVMRLTDTQRICNATIQSLIINLGYSSGVMGEVDIDRVDDEDDPRLMIPNTLRATRPDPRGNGSKAYNFFTIPNLTPSLLAMQDKFMTYAYELVGIPRVAFGSPEGLGTIGRTSGGVAMVLNQSAKSVKYAIHLIEKNIIEPVIQGFVDWELMYGDDPSLKGDIRVRARGISGVIAKESRAQNMDWAIQSLSGLMQVTDPASGQPYIPPDAVIRLVYEKFKLMDIPTDGIFPNYDMRSAIAQDIQALSPDTGMQMPVEQAPMNGQGINGPMAPDAFSRPTVNPMVGGATLDGRSQAAVSTIDTMNGGTAQVGVPQG